MDEEFPSKNPLVFQIIWSRFSVLRHELFGRAANINHLLYSTIWELHKIAGNNDNALIKMRENLQYCLEGLHHLQTIIQDNLNDAVARTEVQLFELLMPTLGAERELLAIRELLEQVTSTFLKDGCQKQQNLHIDVDATVGLHAHRGPIEFVFHTLIAAAVERGGTGSRIDIRWRSNGRFSALEISSMGEPLELRDGLRLFDLTFRNDEAGSSSLYIARSLARRYGFELSYHQSKGAPAALVQHRFELVIAQSELGSLSEGGDA